MSIYKYVLLGAALLATQPSVAAVIKVGPGCTLRQAIIAANTDRRVGKRARGRGADTILVQPGAVRINTYYPIIRTKIAIVSPPTVHESGFEIHATQKHNRVFIVATTGNLHLENVSIFGKGVYATGGFSSNLNAFTSLKSCSITGNPSAHITVQNLIIAGNMECSVGLIGTTFEAENFQIQHPLYTEGQFVGVGIKAADSRITLNNAQINNSAIGIDLNNSTITLNNCQINYRAIGIDLNHSTLTYTNIMLMGNGQGIRADPDSVVEAPPAFDPLPPPFSGDGGGVPDATDNCPDAAICTAPGFDRPRSVDTAAVTAAGAEPIPETRASVEPPPPTPDGE